MTPATKLPNSTAMKFFDWKGDPIFERNPSLESGGTYYLKWSTPPKDENEAIITGAFLVTGAAKSGRTYTFWVPAGAVSADGLSATGCVGGIRPNGLDYTTGDTDFAPTTSTILAGGKIACGIPAVLGELIRSAIQGAIQTGSATLDIGTGASEDVYIKHNGNPWLKQTSAGIAQYWNGSSYVAFNDSIASSLVKVSATDTTPDYLQGKVGSSDSSIVFAVTGSGADETLDMTTALPARISSHAIYTPAYMTGGNSAEATIALWDSLTGGNAGAFGLSLDGTTWQITGCDMTGVTTMAQVASVIQTRIRAITGTLATCTWEGGNHFLITSANTTSSSSVGVLVSPSPATGTDISGAGAGTWMDSETGRGTATAAVLNPAADSGKVGLLNARGSFPADLARDFVDPLGYQAKGGIMVATAANTVDEQAVGADTFGIVADSSQTTGIKWAARSRPLAVVTSAVTVANTTDETNLASVSVPANSLGTANVIKGTLYITNLQGVSNADMQFRLKYGATTIATLEVRDLATSIVFTGRIDFELIANGAAAQVGVLYTTLARNGASQFTTSLGLLDASQTTNIGGNTMVVGTAAEDSTAAKTLSITADWSASSASNTLTVTYGHIELIA